MYADENNGKTINEVWVDSSGYPETGVGKDMYYISDASGGRELGFAKLFTTGILDRSRKSALIFYCPSHPRDNHRSPDWVQPGQSMKNIDKLMSKQAIIGSVLVSVQIRNKWASGVFPNNKIEELKSIPGKWGFDIASDSTKAFIADPWAGYHNGKGVAWFLDGHIESWDSRIMMTRSWYDQIYNISRNQDPAYSYNSREIGWNYGFCFNWLDGKK